MAWEQLIEARAVGIVVDGVRVEGDLRIPPEATGLILFAHGSGSSRHSRRNRFVADILNHSQLATLLFDLLTAEEEAIDARTAELRFNIGLLSERLIKATDWAAVQPEIGRLPVGYFGASTGAAAALMAAAERAEAVWAVVSRGGRPDLAESVLDRVVSPTLLIVGGNDDGVIELNQQAYDCIVAPKHLEIVPGATHLFEEAGALEQVASLATDWFVRHLPGSPSAGARDSLAQKQKIESSPSAPAGRAAGGQSQGQA